MRTPCVSGRRPALSVEDAAHAVCDGGEQPRLQNLLCGVVGQLDREEARVCHRQRLVAHAALPLDLEGLRPRAPLERQARAAPDEVAGVAGAVWSVAMEILT